VEDAQRLDDHLDRLFELERRLNLDAVRRASCGSTPAPSGDSEDISDYHSMVNDVIATAFLCGTSRIAIVKIREASFVDYAGDWHQDVAHQWSSDEPQALLQQANQAAFERAVLDLAYKLDVEEAPGCNVLDSSLIQWTQESGERTHDARSIPVVTFGSAGGNLRTGLYCDYQKRTAEGQLGNSNDPWGYSGLPYSQWLAQVMQMMGVPQSDFQSIEYNGVGGYGLPMVDETYAPTHSPGVMDNASNPLSFLSVT
jgi:hypothetical protein